MFTGLIQDLAKIKDLKISSRSALITVTSKLLDDEVSLGASIAINGVCLTVVERSKGSFSADMMPETLRRSNLGELKRGDTVNLEKSIELTTPLGGHLVSGDVDCRGRVRSIRREGNAVIYEITPEERSILALVVMKGRVAVDGASLTVMGLSQDSFSVSLIPLTQKSIRLGGLKKSALVNLESDLLGKHVARLGSFGQEKTSSVRPGGLSLQTLQKAGFL